MRRSTSKFVIDSPTLMAEWEHDKNKELGLYPFALTVGSNKKAWWRCKKGHEWQAIINNRNNGTTCPYCSGLKAIEGETDLATLNPSLAAEWNYEKNGDLKPTMVTCSTARKVWWRCSHDHEWFASIASRNQGSGCPHCAKEKSSEYCNITVADDATLAAEWDFEKNKSIPINELSSRSKKKVWWKCSKGHEWHAVVRNRSRGTGCPYCAGHRVVTGYTDLASSDPKLAAQWHPTLNGDLTPDNIARYSNKKVWWLCKNGHDWQATVNSRSHGSGCPYCSGYSAIKGETDLATTHPFLLQEWDNEKNIELSPDMVSASSNKKAWWKCSEGHEWQASITTRSAGSKCPYCSGKKLLAGFNDLATLVPNLAAEWNYDKNGDLNPSMVTRSSDLEVWWRCKNGHEWKSKIRSRLQGSNCPYCSGRYVIEGENDLATLNPTLAAEWNYEKNGDLKPAMVSRSSHQIVWWKCANGHEWQTQIRSRAAGSKCPYCSKAKVKEGINDLATTHPEIAAEWNHAKNGSLKPTMVTRTSSQRVWWKCSKGHEWQATINQRIYRNNICPSCRKEQRIKLSGSVANDMK